MPAADRTTPQTIKKKPRRKKKPGTSSGGGGGPQGTGRIVAPKQKAYTRPAPKTQPGPSSNAERKKVERFKETPKYRKAIRAARKEGPATRRGTRRPGGDDKSDADRARAVTYVQSLYRGKRGHVYNPKTEKFEPVSRNSTVPPDVAGRLSKKLGTRKGYEAEVGRVAPALKVLDQTTRPLHAIAAATRANIKDVKQHGFHLLGTPEGRKAARSAALKGIKNEDKSTFSDVAKDLGVKNKTVAGALGFAGDVALDPTTYVTGGTSSVTKKAVLKAAESAEKKALKAGLSKEQAVRFGERAAKQTAKKASERRGVTVRVGGYEVPGMARGTAAVGAQAKKVTDRPKRLKRAKDRARHIASDVNPNIAPEGVTKAEHVAATGKIRTARAKANRGVHEAQQHAVGIREKIGEKNYRKVIDAIEAGNLKSLSPELREAAVSIRSHLRHANRLRKNAGIRGGERKNYIPHHLTDEALEEHAKKGHKASVGSKTIRPSSSKGRLREGTLKDLRESHPGEYNENLAEIFGHRMSEGHTAVAKADLNRELAAMGRDVKKGKPVELGENEAVFHIKGSDIREVTDRKEIQRVVDAGGRNGRYVVLNKGVVKRATEGVTPQLRGKGIVHTLDKAQAGFKTVATATPGFHLRNLVGDIQNAYLGQSGHRIPANLVHASRILKAIGRDDKGLRNLSKGTQGKGMFNTPRYGEVSYDEAAKRLIGSGAARTGYMARDITELASSGRKGIGRPRAPQAVKRAFLNREDLPRVATAVEALRRGATWEQAAQRVADFHFDYQNLTDFERQFARRAAPFYTFSARNIPLQAKSLVTKPGKFAQYQKVREEATKASGVQEEADKARNLYADLKRAGVKVPPGWEKSLSEWEQRNAGIPVSWKGRKYTVSFALPLNDLGEFPGAAGKKQFDEWYQKMMSLATPIAKNPVEYFENHSFFFRDQIEREYSPNVAAPSYVAKFPDGLKKKLGVVKIQDKKSGKMVWGWPGKMDYLAKSVPGSPAFVQQLMTGGADRQGRSTKERVLGFLGAKAVPVDALKTAVNLAYARMDEIKKQQAGLRQQGISAKNPTPEYTKLSEQLRIAEGVAFKARSSAGYKVLPKQGAPKKLRRKSTSPQVDTDLFGRSESRSQSADVFGRSSGSSSSAGTDVFGRSK